MLVLDYVPFTKTILRAHILPSALKEMLGYVTMIALWRRDMGRVSCTCRVARHHLMLVLRLLHISQFEDYQGLCSRRDREKAQLIPRPLTMQCQPYNGDRMCDHCGWLTSNVKTWGECSMCLWEDICRDCKRQGRDTGKLLCPQCPNGCTLTEKDFECPRDYRHTRELLNFSNAAHDLHDVLNSEWPPGLGEHPFASYLLLE